MKKIKRTVLTFSLACAFTLVTGSSLVVDAAEESTNEMTYEESIQNPMYDPSVNNTGVPYENQVVEEGEDGENGPVEITSEPYIPSIEAYNSTASHHYRWG